MSDLYSCPASAQNEQMCYHMPAYHLNKIRSELNDNIKKDVCPSNNQDYDRRMKLFN